MGEGKQRRGLWQNFLHFGNRLRSLLPVTKPLALVASERTIPGSQLLLKLNELGYRTEHVNELGRMIQVVEYMKPLVILIDLKWKTRDPFLTINSLVSNKHTEHTPILAYAPMDEEDQLEKALNMGASIVSADNLVLRQLPLLLDQALELD